MRENYITITKCLIKTINQLSDDQLNQLLVGKGKLVFQSMEDKLVKQVDQNIIDHHHQILQTFSNENEMKIYLKKLKKKDLKEIAEYYDISIVSKDTKDIMINKIYNLLLGAKLRKEMFIKITK